MGKKERGIFWVSLSSLISTCARMIYTRESRNLYAHTLSFLSLFSLLPSSYCPSIISVPHSLLLSFTSLFPSLGASLLYPSYLVVTSCHFPYEGQLQKTERHRATHKLTFLCRVQTRVQENSTTGARMTLPGTTTSAGKLRYR